MPQSLLYILAGVTLSVLFTMAVAKVVNDRGEDSADELSDGDWPAMPEGYERIDCGSEAPPIYARRRPAALVDTSFHEKANGR